MAELAIPCLLVPTKRRHGYTITCRRENGRKIYQSGHKKAYEERFGPVPADMTLDHVCLHKNCIEPTHMEPVTRAENTRRGMISSGRAVDVTRPCRRGHPPNWVRYGNQGWTCKTCRQQAVRRSYAKHLERRRAEKRRPHA